MKQAVYQSTLLIPLPVLTYIFYHLFQNRFAVMGRLLSIEQAQAVDELLAEARLRVRGDWLWARSCESERCTQTPYLL